MRRPIWITLLLFSLSLILAACGPAQTVAATPALGSDTPVAILEQPTLVKPAAIGGPTETPSALNQLQVPVYYDDTYLEIINKSRLEDELIIYSTMTPKNWETVIKIFNSHYPWVKVNHYTLEADQVFQRYFDEVKDEKRTADLVISSDLNGWNRFFLSHLLFYTSQEEVQIPNWARSKFGTYVVFGEPMVMVYNQQLVPNPPKSMADLETLVKNDPEAYQNQIVTYNAENNTLGFATNWFWINAKKQAGWDLLSALGKTRPRLMSSSTEMLETIAKGEAKIGYFIPLSAVLSSLSIDSDLGWSYLADGQPVILTSLAVTRNNTSLSSARLMVDFLLSQEGQYALAQSGLTPYRPDILTATDLHLDKLTALLGDNNVILSSLDSRLDNLVLQENFIAQWKAALGQ